MLTKIFESASRRLDASQGEYGRILRWFWKDSVLRYRRRVAVAVLAEVAGMAAQLAGLYGIFKYAAALDKGGQHVVWGIQFSPRESSLLLAAIGLGVMLAFSIGSFLAHRAASIAARLSTDYEEICGRRSLVYTGALPRPDRPRCSKLLQDRVMSKTGAREARATSRLLGLVVPAVRQFGSLFIFLGIMLVINPAMTVLVGAVAIFAARRLYRLNREKARLSHESDRSIQASGYERRTALREVQDAGRELTITSPEVDAMFSEGENRRYLDASLELDLARLHNIHLLDLMSSVIVVVIVVASGMGVVSGSWSLARLLTYLVMLRYFLTSVKKVGRFFANVSSMYSALQRFYLLVTEAEGTSPEDEDTPPPESLVEAAA